ncbi:inositol polyphosphate multikinase [Venturia canescens]|uniref:inositol polyphosphate multikinase n=1 Tax=Venturia canescens TaxID=32260 RepID=UPI001C9C3D5D|nr:inositol polyphosphate multikinase [Venturia canescens]
MITMETEKSCNKIGSSHSVDESDACATEEDEYPAGTTKFECQVAGHPFDPEKNKIGMLKGENGQVLKSCEKPVLHEREIAFYEAIKNSDDPIYKELATFTPKYMGTMESVYKNRPIKFIVLKDLTEGMTEPCVMDIKIGERTWDPLAGPDKRAADDRKYTASKKAYGFCIPGFQVYDLESGKLRRFNKVYMKKLDAQGVLDALKVFLNASTGEKSPNRQLVVNLLSHLWKILAFFRTQKKLRFYASSLLIVYDAKRLRGLVRAGTSINNAACVIDTRRRTLQSCESSGLSGYSRSNGPAEFEKSARSLSPSISSGRSSVGGTMAKSNRVRAIDRLNRLKRSASLSGCDFTNNSPNASGQQADTKIERSGSFGRGLDEKFSPLCRTHSYTNNYDRDILEIKEDYAALLEKLTGKSRQGLNWVRVNMIDFTHVFDAEDDSVDTNYLRGIENLIKILENFLA